MHYALLALLALLPLEAVAQTPPAAGKIERSAQESSDAIILYGRACRAASEAEWVAVCKAAAILAQKELDAHAKAPPEKK